VLRVLNDTCSAVRREQADAVELECVERALGFGTRRFEVVEGQHGERSEALRMRLDNAGCVVVGRLCQRGLIGGGRN
jgi:hypothetical protein